MLSIQKWFDSEIRFAQVNEKVYAHAGDCAKALLFANPSASVRANVWKDYRFKFNPEGTVGAPAWWLNEYGVCQLLFSSDHPKAIEFQRWVFEEVIPKLASRGGYIFNEKQYVETASAEELQSLKTRIAEMEEKVAFVKSENKRLIRKFHNAVHRMSVEKFFLLCKESGVPLPEDARYEVLKYTAYNKPANKTRVGDEFLYIDLSIFAQKALEKYAPELLDDFQTIAWELPKLKPVA